MTKADHWPTQKTAGRLVRTAAVVLTAVGVAGAQSSASLSGNFANATLNIGKNIHGDVTLVLQMVRGQPQAVGGVTGTRGDVFLFDSGGSLVRGAGFWRGLNNSPYAIRLRPPQELPGASADHPAGDRNAMWIAADNNAGTTMITRPDGTEIMPMILQTIERASQPQEGFAILEAKGEVRWNTDGNLISGQKNLLRITTSGNRSQVISESEVGEDGALYVFTVDGYKYRISALSCDFTATLDELKGTEHAEAATSTALQSAPSRGGLSVERAAAEIRDASRNGDVAKLGELVKSYPGLVSSGDDDGMTPLHWAARYGDSGVARLLLAHGADPDAPANNGATPLHVAARYGHAFVAELLLEKGANVNARDKSRLTPLDVASQWGHEGLESMLRRHGGRE